MNTRKMGWCGAVLVFLAGCSEQKGVQTEDADGLIQGGEPVLVGSVKEAAQFADNNVFNLVDLSAAALLLTADITPVDVEIFYVSDKTTDTGHVVGSVFLAGTVSLAADQTKRFAVNLSHEAFTGGYGAIVTDSIGNGSQDVYQTYLQSGADIWPVGGSVFQGGSYRIPYWATTTRVVITVTNQSDFDFDVQFINVNTTNVKTITLPVLSTYRFDSVVEGWTLTGTSAVQVFTSNGGTVALSAYEQRGSGGTGTKYRVNPVKAAPYFCQ